MTTTTYVLTLAMAAVVVALVLELLRRRHLRGKHALLHLALASAVAAFAVFPGLLTWLAELTGVAVPANLLFFGSLIVLLMLSMQLAYEAGRLEEKTRLLAEEVALLRLDLELLRQPPEQ